MKKRYYEKIRSILLLGILLSNYLNLFSLMIEQVSATSLFEVDFETGDFSQCTDTSISGGTAEVISVDPHHGTHHAYFSRNGTTGGEWARVYKDFSPQDILYFSKYITFKTALPSSGGHKQQIIGFTIIGGATICYAEIYTTASTVWRIMYKNGTSWEYDTSTETVSLDTEYHVELYEKIHGTAGEVSLYVDGVEVCAVTGKDTNDYGSGIDRVEFGLVGSSGEAKAYGSYVDCAIADIMPIGPETEWWREIGTTNQIAGYTSTLYCRWETTPWAFNMSGSIMSTNNTGKWLNSSWVNLNGQNAGYHNESIIVNSTEGITVSYKFIGNNTEGDWQVTEIQNFTVAAVPPPQWTNLGVNNHKNGTAAKFYVKWTDPYFTLSHSILCENITGSDVNHTTTLSGNTDWHNLSLTLPTPPPYDCPLQIHRQQ